MQLEIGSNSNDVKQLQIKLGLTPDGVFGKNTESAVKKYQLENNLVVNGIVGNETWSKMFPVKTNDVNLVDNATKFKLDNIKEFLPESIFNELPLVIKVFNIDTICKLAHFLAQTSWESNGFKSLEENLNYTAEGLCKVFSDYFHNIEKANQFAHNPKAIANHVYANRLGNGNEDSGDGWNYRGRGGIDTTGKYNYQILQKYLTNNVDGYLDDVVANPDLVSSKYPLVSSAIFFNQRDIWQLCVGVSDHSITNVTKKINPALLALNKRTELLARFYNALR